MTTSLLPDQVAFFVPGRARPQGSKRFVGTSKRGRAILIEMSPEVKAWRSDIVAYAQRTIGPAWVPLDVAVAKLTFWFTRPKSVTREYPTVAPDVDKLARAVFDALTVARVVRDDCVIVDLLARKRYRESDAPAGVHIAVGRPGAVMTVGRY